MKSKNFVVLTEKVGKLLYQRRDFLEILGLERDLA